MATPTNQGFIEPPADMMTPPGQDPLAAILAAAAQAGGKGDPEDEKKSEDVVRIWFKRIAAAKKFKEKWEKDYEVDRCHDYVRGFQRDTGDELDAQGEHKYQINKILTSLKTRIPALFYYFPYVRVRPARGRADSVGSQIQDRADLLQDTINTIIRQPKTRLKPETMMALKEAHWAFGVVESGYDADWGENPFQQKPVLVENDQIRKELEEADAIPPEPEEDDVVGQALSKLEEVPHDETFYVKHIPARQFYVSANDRSSTETQDWVGYWEWMYVEDVKRCPSFQNTDGIKANAKNAEGTGSSESSYEAALSPIGANERTKDVPADMIRIWKIWDQREKKRYVLAEGHNQILKQTDYYYLPLSILRFEVMPGEWYPIPPISQQLTEQDEFNDSREWLRLVRKGTRPRYIYDKNAFTADELEKLENDEFFTMIAAENGNVNAISPVMMPQISDAVIRTLALADSGLSEQSASSPIDRLTRSAGGKPTATEVQAMGSKGDVRDSYEQQEVAEWLAQISSSLIKCALEKMTLPKWVLINSDPTGPNFGTESQVISQKYEQYKQIMTSQQQADAGTLQPSQPGQPPQGGPQPQQGGGIPAPVEPQPRAMQQPGQPTPQPYQEVTPDMLKAADDGMQWEITVDVESLSPVTEADQGNKIMQALNLLAASPVGQLLSLSPPLLKSMLNFMGIRNSSDQQNIFNALQAKAQAEQQAAQAGAGQPGGVAPMPGGGNPNKQGSGPQQPAGQGEAPAKPGGPQPNAPPPAQPKQ